MLKNLDFSRFLTVKLKLLFHIPHCCVSMNSWPIISAQKEESSFFAVTLDQLHSSAAGEWFLPGCQNVDGKKHRRLMICKNSWKTKVLLENRAVKAKYTVGFLSMYDYMHIIWCKTSSANSMSVAKWFGDVWRGIKRWFHIWNKVAACGGETPGPDDLRKGLLNMPEL